MTKQNAVWAYPNSSLGRKFPKPGFVFTACMPKSIIVRELSEIVVPRISVTALALRESVSDRVVVISLNNRNPCLAQNVASAVWRWTECAEITEAVESLDSTG